VVVESLLCGLDGEGGFECFSILTFMDDTVLRHCRVSLPDLSCQEKAVHL